MVTRKLMDLGPISDKLQQVVAEKTKNILSITGDTVNITVSVKDMIEEYLTEKNVVEPRVYITTTAHAKLRALVDRYDKEIGMYGTVEHILNNTVEPNIDCYIITDILVYPQTTSGATCNQDEDRMWEFEMSLTTEQVNAKRFHIHSHVNMATSPSGVDEDFYARTMTQVNDYFIVSITNKRNDYFIRFYDAVNNIIYEGLPLYIIKENGESIDDWYNKQIKDNIVEPKPTYTSTIVTGKMPEQKSGYYSHLDDDFDNDDDFWDAWDRRHESYSAVDLSNRPIGKRGRPPKKGKR